MPVLGFVPNVNILVEPVGSLTIRAYLTNASAVARQFGQNEVTSVADDETQSALRVFFSPDPLGRPVYQFQRILISGGNCFIVTASQLPPMDQVGERLRNELSAILNSFRL